MDVPRLCILLFSFWNLGTESLKLERVSVPQYVLVGDSVVLQCVFELGSDRLYSVTWYKDHEQFFHYVPRSTPSLHLYPLQGVSVNERTSGAQQVELESVQLQSTGHYRCEVSAEAPTFTSAHAGATLRVVALAKDGPHIAAAPGEYGVGDVVHVNCSSGQSYPAARLRWFINDRQVRSEEEAMVWRRGLVSSQARLQLWLEPCHVVKGRLELRCLATTGADGVLPLLDSRQALLLLQVSSSAKKVFSTIALLSTAVLCVLRRLL